MNICVNWLFKNLGIENAFERVDCACLCSICHYSSLHTCPLLSFTDVSVSVLLSFLFDRCFLSGSWERAMGWEGNHPFFPPHFLMLSTHWLNFGPCGYFHQSHSYTGLHLCRMFSLRGFSLLFLMLKWPLVVKYSHCTFLSLVLQSTTDADDWEPSETAFSG